MRTMLLALALLAATVALAPAASADGCTFATTAYACTLEETGARCDSEGFTSVGAGVGGTAGVGFAGFDQCDQQYVVATVSVGTVFVDLLWLDGSGGCGMLVFTSAASAPAPCLASPPQPGWGHLLP